MLAHKLTGRRGVGMFTGFSWPAPSGGFAGYMAELLTAVKHGMNITQPPMTDRRSSKS